MERLTRRDIEGFPILCKDTDWNGLKERLAAYEDTGLAPEEVSGILDGCRGIGKQDWMVTLFGEPLGEWYQIAKAKEEDRLLTLPCKVGETAWRIVRRMVDVTGYRMEWELETLVEATKFSLDMLDAIGKTVFLTREEAEAALNGGQNDV